MSDSESVDESYLEAISSSSGEGPNWTEGLIHLPVVFSSRRLTLHQNRRMAQAPPVIETYRKIDISHFVTQSEHIRAANETKTQKHERNVNEGFQKSLTWNESNVVQNDQNHHFF